MYLSIITGLFTTLFYSQNSKITCYFNHPVNTSLSTGVNATYLNASILDTAAAFINRAQNSIDFCIYDFLSTGTGIITTAINNAYARGVKIRWIYNGSSSNSGLSTLNTGITTLGSPTTSAYGICHNKFMIIDAASTNSNNAFVWTGSCNFTAQQNASDYNNVIIFQSQSMAQVYTGEFNKMWGSTTTTPNLSSSTFGPYKTPTAANQHTFNVGGSVVDVYFSPKDGADVQLKNAISTANSDLFFGIYTFTDNSIALAISTAISSGVLAKGIEDQSSKTYQPYATLTSVMSANNFRIYSGGYYLYHNKIMLIDATAPTSDPLVCTGSFNWTNSAETKNDENFVIVHDASIANQYYQSLCNDITVLGGSPCPPIASGIVENQKNRELLIYPNPTKDIVNINLADIKSVKLFNQTGQEFKIDFNSDLKIIDLKNITNGVYYLQINSSQQTINKTIVVLH
ncbi:MAG: T9SS type A sorting domain-containing protein [Bacteroidetes bacterium]|nr:T9SS type A sorting domain-containing protein [Bacteroidota bacterium]